MKKVAEVVSHHSLESATSENVAKSVPSKPSCLKCLEYEGHIVLLKAHNQNLVDDLTSCTEPNRVLKSNENDFKNRIKTLTKEVSELKKTVLKKQDAIFAYLDSIDETKRELANAHSDFETLKGKLKSYSNSSYVLDHIVKSQNTKEPNHCVGYNACPPPIYNNFTKLPDEDKITEFKVTTPLVVGHLLMSVILHLDLKRFLVKIQFELNLVVKGNLWKELLLRVPILI